MSDIVTVLGLLVCVVALVPLTDRFYLNSNRCVWRPTHDRQDGFLSADGAQPRISSWPHFPAVGFL